LVLFGYLFLSEPVIEDIPIPDFRTVRNQDINKPSLNLLDTIQLCQSRQDWYREYAQKNRLGKVKFINTASSNRWKIPQFQQNVKN